MAEVRLNVYLKDKDSGEFKKVIAQINPNCANDKLVEFVEALNGLTTNKISAIWKVVEDYLSPAEDDFVTVADIKKILRGDYKPVEVDDPITRDDIQLILTGNFEPEPDPDSWSPDDFVF